MAGSAQMADVELSLEEIWRAVADAAAKKAGFLRFPSDGTVRSLAIEYGGLVVLGVEGLRVVLFDGYSVAVIHRRENKDPNVCSGCGAVGAVVNRHGGGVAAENARTVPIPIHWQCSVCRKHVCYNCRLTVPGEVPEQFYLQIYCSEACRQTTLPELPRLPDGHAQWCAGKTMVGRACDCQPDGARAGECR